MIVRSTSGKMNKPKYISHELQTKNTKTNSVEYAERNLSWKKISEDRCR